MKRNSLVQNAVTALLVLAVFVIPLSLSVSGQGGVTTSQYYTNNEFTISGASSGTCHHFEVPMGAANPGDVIAGSVSSDGGGVTFAIVNTDDYQSLLSSTANTCTWLDNHSRYLKEGQSFQFQWTVSALTAYYLVMLNKNSNPITVTLSAYLITSPGQSYIATSNAYLTSTPYSSATEVPTATYTPPSTVGPLALPFDSTYLAIGLGVAVLAAFLLWLGRSSNKPKPSDQLRAPSEMQQNARFTREGVQKQLCPNCGRQIPRGSRFCGKCGAAQTQA